MESNEETLADKLEQTLNSKNKLKGIINRLSSEGIGSKKFSDYDTVLKNLPFLYNVRTIPGTVVAEFNKNNTPFNFNNNTEFKYYPVGGDTDLNNGNRVISKQNLSLDSSETEIKFDDFFNYDDTATSFALNYSEAFGTLKKFKVNSKALYLNIEPNTAVNTPPWSVEDSPNLEMLDAGKLYFRVPKSQKKVLFKNLNKLSHLSLYGEASYLAQLSTMVFNCPKLKTVRLKLKPTQYTNLEELTNTLIIDQSLEEVHLIINSADTTGKCYLQGLITSDDDYEINELTLESVNTENSVTELMLYTDDNYYEPALTNVRKLKLAKDFDCCLLLGNLHLTVIEQLPQILENLKYNGGNKEDRYLQIHPIVKYNYSTEIKQAIKDILEEKNWTYIENY